ncbi:MAG: MmcQ/YjbR family DNA-binding protein [Bacteroidetes bacterium]|uniref:MmcQ/YjbR family DNA-binding protein n=1 Tax=Phaeocystidibacter marisrubri TaxID=1577780 RepID=A0A6L3ZEQ2_9FLAO|nr:MmcQ/YjbR family DNA-binding protein [Phaeocystidibacter marisrubri]KAB2816160.1 MmcQ/YjbR family DNA-binding protein [Phaeocystidibacter marisrubri]TNE26305.1 MAG: MmcQ/YjbR family DNA-binding protein [Bacteroidota bacterium]GGH67630.1 hypothetical protein GCM10011318_06810 [Phaeocystidibacter marisrubri]
MNVEELRSYCIQLKGATESFPFDEETLVLKVMEQKMFAIIPLESPHASISLKCNPERAIELREEYEGIQPGWHLNKVHWNSVNAEQVPADLVRELIDHSYDLIVSSLTKKLQRELSEL